MFFTKYPHASNFSFATSIADGELKTGSRKFTLSAEAFGNGVYRIGLKNPSVWRKTRRIVELNAGDPLSKLDSLKLTRDGFEVGSLRTVRGAGIGVSGEASMFQFEVGPEARFYGMGEKTFGRLELSGLRAKYWNTDVWGDFHFAQWIDHPADPPYASVPYLIVEQKGIFVGLLLDNPYPTFMETPGRTGGQEVFVEWQRTSKKLILGSEGGEPTLWILVGPTLAELTKKLQKLVGTTPLPPIWALGYHQSRWGYAGEKDLLDLDRKFTENGIPCDGLWLDIDYMQGYRVFTIDPKLFPGGLAKTAAKLGSRKIVAILDPGVKCDPGYCAYDEGIANNLFCKSSEGKPFIGMVWPGETAFPDFTIGKGQTWWAAKTRDLAKQGFGGFWIDMNDPSTGPVDPTGMRFNAGREPHEAHHNQYALGMQKASFAGLRQAFPSRRPFLLSRSAFTGTSRYSAVWTGDNLSNRFYLKAAIPTTLNLALSGIPFNGCDVGGFGGDTNEALMVDWMKTCFLFPFCRNHTSNGTRNQEPWAFSKKALSVIRHYIRLRYKLMPYLYQLHVRQDNEGEAVLRPVFYDFPGFDSEGIDQFMVGPCILQAPMLEEGAKRRKVRLPGKGKWFDASTGNWTKTPPPLAPEEEGDRGMEVKAAFESTPLYVRDGSIVPMRKGIVRDNKTDLRRPEFHMFISSTHVADQSGLIQAEYFADDGETYGYRRGKRSRIDVRVAKDRKGIAIVWNQTERGYGLIRPTFVIHGTRRAVTLNGRKANVSPTQVRLTGRPFRAWRVG